MLARVLTSPREEMPRQVSLEPQGVRLNGGGCRVVDTSWSPRSIGDGVHSAPAGLGVLLWGMASRRF